MRDSHTPGEVSSAVRKPPMEVSSTNEGSSVQFNLWLVMFLALMPVFLLFTGLSAAAAFQSSAEWKVIGMVVAAAIAAGCLATRSGGELAEETPTETTVPKDAYFAVRENDAGNEASYSSPPCFMHELDLSDLGNSSLEELLSPAFRRSLEEQTQRERTHLSVTNPVTRDKHVDSRSEAPIS